MAGLLGNAAKLARILFRSEGHVCSVFLMFSGCLLLALLKEVLAYYVGILPSGYYLALGSKDVDLFGGLVAYSVCLLVFISLTIATGQLLSGFLYVTWRKLLTNRLHALYLNGSRCYDINELIPAKQGAGACDNADQRITQDVEKLCNELSQMVSLLIISPFLIGYYLYQSYVATGYTGPVAVVVFFVVATIVNRLLMKPVMTSVYAQEKEEGNFRYYHMLVRRNCEAGAFYKAARREAGLCRQRLEALADVQKGLIFRQYWLNGFTKLCDYFASILSYIIVAFPIFYGQYGQLPAGELSALVSRYAFVSIYLFNCFTNLIDLSVSAATIGGLADRICELVALAERLGLEADDLADGGVSRRRRGGGEPSARARPEDGDGSSAEQRSREDAGDGARDGARDGQAVVIIESLHVRTPGQSDGLIANLTLTLRIGSNLLITGSSGSGKSSLFRVIFGLWKEFEGRVTVTECCRRSVFVVPQTPYFVAGSLADQVVLPEKNAGFTVADHEEIFAALAAFELQHLITRFGLLRPLGSSVSWYSVLSAGECQRLCLARALYHRPRMLFLDEATSSIDEAMEQTVYETLREKAITVVSIGHRSTLRRYHKQQLHLLPHGTWQLSDIDDSS